MHFSVEYTHVTVLLVSVREDSTLTREGAFHVPLHVGHGLEQYEVAEMKETNVEIILLPIHDGGDTVELEEVEVVGEMSNPISFNNSLGAKAGVVCNCGRGDGGGGGMFSFFLCFLCFFFSLPVLLALSFGMVSTIFCKELMGE